MDPLLAFRLGTFLIFGLLFGSFGNVVIWRLPRGESLVAPGSHCPVCDHPVRWYDNVPVASWIVLRGRCRDCGSPISTRYPAVEALSGILFVLAAARFELLPQAVAAAIMFWFLLVLSLIDIDVFRLPNVLVGPLAVSGATGVIIAGFTSSPVVPLVSAWTTGAGPGSVIEALIGLLLGAGLSALAAFAYHSVRGSSGLGMGDIKLLGALGLWLGPLVLLALFIGSLVGAIGGLATQRGGEWQRRRIPFGPYLASGAIVTALAGEQLLRWYLGLVGIG